MPATSCEPDDPTRDTLQDRLIKQSALLCVSTAQRVVSILNQYQGVDGSTGLLPAWWYRLYYLFTAAAILITARLRPEIFEVTNIADSWTQAMSLLRKHEMFGSSARRCVAALHILSSKMTEAVPAGAIFPKSQWEAGSSVTDGHTEVSPQHYERRNACRSAQHGDMNESQAFSSIDLDGIDLAELDFNLSDLSWFNDVHAAWDIINFG